MTENLPPIAVRSNRVKTAIGLGTPDRVPFVPMMGYFYALGYGVTIQDAMTDVRKVIPAMEQFAATYDPDLFYTPGYYPIDLLEAARPTNMMWPGETHHLPPDSPFQTLDRSFVDTEEDWAAFLRDPSLFLLTKTLPEKYQSLAGLRMLNPYQLSASSPYSLINAGLPPVREALLKLVELGDLAMGAIGRAREVIQKALDMGYPIFGSTWIVSPFDEFAGSQRGLITTTMDLYEDPERYADAVSRWAEAAIPRNVASAKAMHAQYVLIPLHCGVDEFMSPENYRKYYWPPLKRLIEALIAADITPAVFCEGNYNTRLEQLCDVPKGKVIYFFEKVDIKRAKKVLGGTACIAGNMHNTLLSSGTVEQVKDATKKMLEDCAPGGGFIMSNAMSLDNAEHKLLEAWHETTLLYGKY